MTTTSEPAHLTAGFFARVAPWQQFLTLFDHLEGVTFFVKDIQGRYMAFGDGSLRCLDYGAPESLIGRTDYDLYPKQIADRIFDDDRRIIAQRTPLFNLVELLVNPRFGVIGWYVTNKFPVVDQSGEIIGIMGTVQPYHQRRVLLAGTSLDRVVERIRNRPSDEHPLEDLAKQAGLSTRQLGRKFHEYLGMAPRDFIGYCRIAQACRALAHTEEPITQIALDCGYYDQSAFAFQFRKTIGLAPSEYRKRYFASRRAADI